MKLPNLESLLRLRKRLAEVALFLFLMTALPAVYAMSQIERRELNRTAIVQVYTRRSRNRALYRRYGIDPFSSYYLPLSS